MSLRVLIAGGGLGGLTLAHALRNARLEPAIFERDHADSSPANSYRIHIDATGSRALRACLPPELWHAFVQRSGLPPRGIAFTTERLRQLGFAGWSDSAYPISRSGLRQLLLTGLEDVARFDKRVVRFEQAADQQVVAHFADGSSASGDVLVGADGFASAVRKQLVPHARVVDTGVAGIAGKVHLTPRVRDRIPPELLSQMTMVLPTRGPAMFMATLQRQNDQSPEDLHLPEHLFWVVIGRVRTLGLSREIERAPTSLRRLALGHTQRWHPLLPWLIEETHEASLVGVPLSTSQLVAPWQSTNITLLGDAIHTMPPLQGLGGNTALRDAAVLAHYLIEVDRGRAPLVEAIGAYEAAMLDYGFDAVRRSVQATDGVTTTSTVARLAFRTLLRAADHFPPLNALLFRRPEVTLPPLPAPLSTARVA